ncbi:uncharacterized protein KNAG_0D01260 [Huiozyma naganishii CBS 8797]|uniref:Uncharacterized protein n=1 Tax=Huiozyma naganishii (strain ATCC MYA-139 / BCRC 22969 / CBS 8797 / KCTC 17520 / NBRC 10181 / NCYC 3082 / Yp74L-3) TaxID=1071383 RepID=J7RK46_HUIN7|nr:hypothetical protein KNAG_0D01260 [Kazachstania naganishii CBS 8797]CCK69878.1 hypothetical protein KNAG_0D01260 [Kazachstania naganishii CBS 8797]
MSKFELKVAPTKDEYSTYRKYFRTLDTESTKVVMADAAKHFMEQSLLPPKLLGAVWNLVDTDGKGFLVFQEFVAFCRSLAYLKQSPRASITPSLYAKPVKVLYQAQVQRSKSPSTSRRRSSSSTPDLPLVSETDHARFSQLFSIATSGSGTLSGDKAREIFGKAKLPNEVLGDIWFLCDREQDGSLTEPEFVMTMHLVGLCIAKNPKMTPVPKRLSRQLWKSAGLELPHSRSSSSGSLSRNASCRSSSSLSKVKRSSSRQEYQTDSPVITRTLSRSSSPSLKGGSPVFASLDSNVPVWRVTLDQKHQFIEFFNKLDKDNAGRLGPHILVPFFMKSGLTRDTLANIWDLADLSKTGTLDNLEFCIAMSLISKVKTARISLPSKIPEELLSSLRDLQTPPVTIPSASNAMKSSFQNLPDTSKNVPHLGLEGHPQTEAGQNLPLDSSEISERREKIKSLKTGIKDASYELTEVTQLNESQEKEISELKQLEELLMEKLEFLSNSIREANDKSAKLEDSILNSKKITERLKQEVTTAEGNFHACEARHSAAEEDLREVNRANDALKKELGEIEIMSAELRPKLELKQKEYLEVKGKVGDNEEKLSAEKLTVANIQMELEGMDAKLKLLSSKKTELSEYEKMLEVQHKKLEEKHQLLQKRSDELEKFEKELKDKKIQVASTVSEEKNDQAAPQNTNELQHSDSDSFNDASDIMKTSDEANGSKISPDDGLSPGYYVVNTDVDAESFEHLESNPAKDTES